MKNDLWVFPVVRLHLYASSHFKHLSSFPSTLSLTVWPHWLILFLTSIFQGVRSPQSRLNKATEYSSSSDDLSSSDDEERNRSDFLYQCTICISSSFIHCVIVPVFLYKVMTNQTWSVQDVMYQLLLNTSLIKYYNWKIYDYLLRNTSCSHFCGLSSCTQNTACCWNEVRKYCSV